MPETKDLDIWWSSLSIAQKERIARKGLTKANPGSRIEESDVTYPACTTWWLSLSPQRKAYLREHCEGRHGYVMKGWEDANPYGD